MENLRWVSLILLIVGTIFKAIGDRKEAQKFGPFTITSLVFYSIGVVICIIVLINSLS